jgi:hypothetical protein
MNAKQKNGVIGAIALVLLLIGLHNPFAGYVTFTGGTLKTSLLLGSYVEGATELDFLDRYSSGAIFPWIDSIGEVIGYCLLVLILGGAIFLINRSSGKGE